MVDVGDADASVAQHVVERGAAAAQQVGGHFLEVGTGQGLVQMHRGAVRGHGQVLHGDGGAGGAGQFLLGLLSSFLQTLQGDLVLAQVNAVLVLDFADEPVDDLLVPIVAAQVVVAVGGLHLMVEKPSSSLPISSRDTSKVPPPRSKTRMRSSSLPFSRP